ncbi:MAG: MFS transporter [Anaerolineae bacterium]|nr:MFS transporter [Anaerolineae bacterium]
MVERQTTVSPGAVLLPLIVGTALSQFGNATLYVVLPTHTAQAGIALGAVGILFSANRAIRLLLNGPVGLAYDRWPRRWLFVPALFVGALSTSVVAAARGFWPLLVARLLWGLAWSSIWVGGTAIVLETTTEGDRGRWTGLYQIGFFMGLALGTFAGGLLTDWLGYRVTMWIASAAGAVGGLAAWFGLSRTRVLRRRAAPSLTRVPALKWHAERRLWAVLLLHAINEWATNGVLAGTIALLVQKLLPATHLALGVATATGVLGAMRLLLGMVTAPLAGTLSDRVGRRWPIVLGGLAIGAASMVAVSSPVPALAFAGIILGALSGASVRALLTALTGDLVDPAQRGAAIGAFNVSGDLGTAAGPVLAYALLERVGLSWLYLICAGLYVAGWIGTVPFCRQERPLGDA